MNPFAAWYRPPKWIWCVAALSAMLVWGVAGRPWKRAASPAMPPAAPVLLTDFFGDGTPDFLRLTSSSDRRAFQQWFTFLAETPYWAAPGESPAEVKDCAALLRFAYREALRLHDGRWASALGLRRVPAAGAIDKVQYPFTPLGAQLFRIRPGPFLEPDLSDGAFAEFADARTLLEYNTHFRTRDIGRAEPGDLLFYRQLGQNMPFHAMIYLGRSQHEESAEECIVYHTGPDGAHPGEIRRPSVPELLHHPLPRWRPLTGNTNFLGVYRWNILRDEELEI